MGPGTLGPLGVDFLAQKSQMLLRAEVSVVILAVHPEGNLTSHQPIQFEGTVVR